MKVVSGVNLGEIPGVMADERRRGAGVLSAGPKILVIVPALLVAAGIVLSSSQDRALGDIVAQNSTLNGQITYYAALASSLVLLAFLVGSYRSIIARCRTNLLLCSLIGVAVASCVWSQSPFQSLKASVLLCASTAFIIWVTVKVPPGEQMKLMMVTGLSAAIISIVVVVVLPSHGLDKFHEMAWQGAFYSKNHMGRMFLFFLTPAVHYSGKVTTGRISYIIVMVFMIAMSQSKTALIALLLYMLLAAGMKVTSRFSGRSGQIIVLVLAVIFLCAAILVVQYLDEVLGVMGSDSSLTGRTGIWRVLLISVQKRPWLGFGYQEFWAGTTSEGFNAFVALRSLAGFTGSYAHSGYLAVLLEEGVVGLALLGAVIAKAAIDGWQCLTGNHAAYIRWYFGLVLLSAIYNVDEVTFMLSFYLPWMMFVLAAVGLADEARKIRSRARA